jgi:hypothetical protein
VIGNELLNLRKYTFAKLVWNNFYIKNYREGDGGKLCLYQTN